MCPGLVANRVNGRRVLAAALAVGAVTASLSACGPSWPAGSAADYAQQLVDTGIFTGDVVESPPGGTWWVFAPKVTPDLVASDMVDDAQAFDEAHPNQGVSVMVMTSSAKAAELAAALDYPHCGSVIAVGGPKPDEPLVRAIKTVFPQCSDPYAAPGTATPAPAGTPDIANSVDAQQAARRFDSAVPSYTPTAIPTQPSPGASASASPGASGTASGQDPASSATSAVNSGTLKIGVWHTVDYPAALDGAFSADPNSDVHVTALRLQGSLTDPTLQARIVNTGGVAYTVNVDAYLTDSDGSGGVSAAFGGPAGGEVTVAAGKTATTSLPYYNLTGYAVPMFPTKYDLTQLKVNPTGQTVNP